MNRPKKEPPRKGPPKKGPNKSKPKPKTKQSPVLDKDNVVEVCTQNFNANPPTLMMASYLLGALEARGDPDANYRCLAMMGGIARSKRNHTWLKIALEGANSRLIAPEGSAFSTCLYVPSKNPVGMTYDIRTGPPAWMIKKEPQAASSQACTSHAGQDACETTETGKCDQACATPVGQEALVSNDRSEAGKSDQACAAPAGQEVHASLDTSPPTGKCDQASAPHGGQEAPVQGSVKTTGDLSGMPPLEASDIQGCQESPSRISKMDTTGMPPLVAIVYASPRTSAATASPAGLSGQIDRIANELASATIRPLPVPEPKKLPMRLVDPPAAGRQCLEDLARERQQRLTGNREDTEESMDEGGPYINVSVYKAPRARSTQTSPPRFRRSAHQDHGQYQRPRPYSRGPSLRSPPSVDHSRQANTRQPGSGARPQNREPASDVSKGPHHGRPSDRSNRRSPTEEKRGQMRKRSPSRTAREDKRTCTPRRMERWSPSREGQRPRDTRGTDQRADTRSYRRPDTTGRTERRSPYQEGTRPRPTNQPEYRGPAREERRPSLDHRMERYGPAREGQRPYSRSYSSAVTHGHAPRGRSPSNSRSEVHDPALNETEGWSQADHRRHKVREVIEATCEGLSPKARKQKKHNLERRLAWRERRRQFGPDTGPEPRPLTRLPSSVATSSAGGPSHRAEAAGSLAKTTARESSRSCGPPRPEAASSSTRTTPTESRRSGGPPHRAEAAGSLAKMTAGDSGRSGGPPRTKAASSSTVTAPRQSGQSGGHPRTEAASSSACATRSGSDPSGGPPHGEAAGDVDLHKPKPRSSGTEPARPWVIDSRCHLSLIGQMFGMDATERVTIAEVTAHSLPPSIPIELRGLVNVVRDVLPDLRTLDSSPQAETITVIGPQQDLSTPERQALLESYLRRPEIAGLAVEMDFCRPSEVQGMVQHLINHLNVFVSVGDCRKVLMVAVEGCGPTITQALVGLISNMQKQGVSRQQLIQFNNYRGVPSDTALWLASFPNTFFEYSMSVQGFAESNGCIAGLKAMEPRRLLLASASPSFILHSTGLPATPLDLGELAQIVGRFLKVDVDHILQIVEHNTRQLYIDRNAP